MSSYSYKNYDNATDAYNKTVEIITPEYVKKFGVPCDIDNNDSDKIITASGKGFTLTLTFGDSSCDIDIKVGLLLKPLKGTIVSRIMGELEKNL